MSRYELTVFEWRVIEPLLSNKPRGVPRTTRYNRFACWRTAGVADRGYYSLAISISAQGHSVDLHAQVEALVQAKEFEAIIG